jgi:hypothetical protein
MPLLDKFGPLKPVKPTAATTRPILTAVHLCTKERRGENETEEPKIGEMKRCEGQISKKKKTEDRKARHGANGLRKKIERRK